MNETVDIPRLTEEEIEQLARSYLWSLTRMICKLRRLNIDKVHTAITDPKHPDYAQLREFFAAQLLTVLLFSAKNIAVSYGQTKMLRDMIRENGLALDS